MVARGHTFQESLKREKRSQIYSINENKSNGKTL